MTVERFEVGKTYRFVGPHNALQRPTFTVKHVGAVDHLGWWHVMFDDGEVGWVVPGKWEVCEPNDVVYLLVHGEPALATDATTDVDTRDLWGRAFPNARQFAVNLTTLTVAEVAK